MIGQYKRVSPTYIAMRVSGFLAADGVYCLSCVDDLAMLLLEATFGAANWSWDAKHGQLKIEWMRHRHSWCIGQVVVFNTGTNDFEVWGATEFEREFRV